MRDAGIAHALAMHPQQKVGARAEQRAIDGDRLLDVVLRQRRNTGGDATVQRQQQRAGGGGGRRQGRGGSGCAMKQANAACDAGLELQIALTLDCAQVLINALAIVQVQRARQIRARGRQSMVRDELADEPQDLLLARA